MFLKNSCHALFHHVASLKGKAKKQEQHSNWELAATKKNGRFTENVFYMTSLPGSIKCLLQ